MELRVVVSVVPSPVGVIALGRGTDNSRCLECIYVCESKTQLQLHAVAMHDSYSVVSIRIGKAWRRVCLLRFDGRGQRLEHVGKCG